MQSLIANPHRKWRNEIARWGDIAHLLGLMQPRPIFICLPSELRDIFYSIADVFPNQHRLVCADMYEIPRHPPHLGFDPSFMKMVFYMALDADAKFFVHFIPLGASFSGRMRSVFGFLSSCARSSFVDCFLLSLLPDLCVYSYRLSLFGWFGANFLLSRIYFNILRLQASRKAMAPNAAEGFGKSTAAPRAFSADATLGDSGNGTRNAQPVSQ